MLPRSAQDDSFSGKVRDVAFFVSEIRSDLFNAAFGSPDIEPHPIRASSN
jgi:hypothetical protein